MEMVPDRVSMNALIKLWVDKLTGLTPEQKEIVVNALGQFDSYLYS